jgi:DNA-binding NarL/FixJ family response regulator
MERTRSVIVCGSHLVMSTICASLREKPGFQVQQVEGFLPEIIQELELSPPDVILFDLAAAQPHFAIPLLRQHPTIKLIGIDLMSNAMLLFSSQQSRLLTADDLAQVIEGFIPPHVSPVKEPSAAEGNESTCE